MADDIAPGTPAATAAPTVPVAGNEAANPSHRDWNAMSQNMRQANDAIQSLTKILSDLPAKLVAPAAPVKAERSEATPANGTVDTAAVVERVAKLERALAVKSAIVDHKLSGDALTTFEEMAGLVASDQLNAIAEKIAKLQRPADTNAGAPATAPAATAPTTPSVKPGTSNAGPAAPGAAPIIPDRIEDISREVLRTMSVSELREKYEKQKRAAGQGNPFAAAREALKK